ncbi:hypothetical protein B0H16DRAFT_1736777 [Mycena metata]|uniref:Uncharacterized protein n=1 Tax=Mycena metata TaxID=1033252 RepID=A0AAD7MMM1_9AGAR|nr:hypothetical protein B0H16DRAFT_1736777 [Mycena metata]
MQHALEFIASQRVALSIRVRHPTALDLGRYGALYLKTPPAQLLDILSFHHVLVDPARIPTQERLDPLSSAAKITIEVAMLSIEALFKTKIPSAARSDLWPRVFVWVQFIQTFRKFLSDLKFVMASKEDLCVGFVTFSRIICENLSLVEGLAGTPGFQVIATRGWACALQQTDSHPDNPGDMDIRILRTMHSVYLALLARGLLKYATTAACALGQTGLSSSENVQDNIGYIEAYICVLVVAFKKQAGYRLIPDAIQNGLLHAILALSKQEVTNDTSDLISCLLVDILGPAPVYHSVLVKLRTTVSSGLETTSLSRPKLYEAWKTFSATLNGRIKVLTAFESTRHLSQRACDNIEASLVTGLAA